MTTSKAHYWLLVFVIIVGFGIRFVYLDRDMRFDESVTVIAFASKSIPSIVADYSAPNNHIFHSIFVHLTYTYLGEAPIFVRLPAFIFGVLLIPMTYVTAHRFYDRQTGVIAASLVAIFPILIDFSVNARGYTLLTLIITTMLYLGHRLQRHDDTGGWLLFGLLAALGFWTVPTMLYAMGAIGLWMLLSIWHYNQGEERQLLLKNFIVSMVLGAILTLVLYALVIRFSGIESLIGNVNILPIPPAEYYPQFDHVLGRIWEHIMWGQPLVMVIGLVIAFLTGLALHRRLAQPSLNLIPFFVVWIIPLLLIQRVIPFRRTWMFLVPVCIMIAASSLAYLIRFLETRRQVMFQGIAILVISLGMVAHIIQSQSIITSNHTLRAPDSERAAFFLNERVQENDRVIMFIPSNYTVLYYSMLYGFASSDETLQELAEDTVADEQTTGNTYLFYQTTLGDIEYLDLWANVPEVMEQAEVLIEWDFGVVLIAEQ